ncbi:MAG: hypothetical protein AB1486_11240 [Planctomycetota bacterium]
MGSIAKGSLLLTWVLVLCLHAVSVAQEGPSQQQFSRQRTVATSETRPARMGSASPALGTGLALLIAGGLVVLLLARDDMGKMESGELP